jgi:hypothetical protein
LASDVSKNMEWAARYASVVREPGSNGLGP